MTKPILYPLCGLLSLLIGILIVDSGLNVHSGEIFLWLLGVFGFILIIPLVLFVISIRLLKIQQGIVKTMATIFTILLGLSWIATIIVGVVFE